MKKQLTSRLTLFYKVIFPAFWSLMIIGIMIFTYVDSRDAMTFFMILMLLPILLFTKLQQISYDDGHIYVSNLRTNKIYELKDVKAINDGNIMSLDPFFEIEIRNKNGSIDKVDFMPKIFEQLTFMLTRKYTGHLYDIKTKILHSKN